MFGGAAAGDGSGSFVAAGEDFADAAGSVFGWNALEARVSHKKAFALRESHGMRGDGTDGIERRTGAANESMLNREDSLRDHPEIAGEQEVVDTDDGTGEGIFDGGEESIVGAFFDGAESGIEGGAGNGSDGGAEKLKGGFFAEGAGLALEGDAHLHFRHVCSAHNLIGLGEAAKLLRRHGLSTG